MTKLPNLKTRADCCVAASLCYGVLITEASQRFQTTRSNNASSPFASATMNSTPFVMITSMLAMRFTRCTSITSGRLHCRDNQSSAKQEVRRIRNKCPRIGSAWNAFQHFSVRREFFHEHQKTLNGFLRFVTGEAAPDEIDLFQFPRLQQEFFAARSGQKDVNGRINALIADFSVQDHFHVARTFELLKNQLVHTASGFDQGC